MADKLTVKEAEARLKALEKPKHDVALANVALKRAESDGDVTVIKATSDRYIQAVQAEAAANVSHRDIERASQAVLEAREEAHTETNVLPEHHGLREVLANNALATALGTARGRGMEDADIEQLPAIQKARKDLADAIEQDAADKAAHVAESHQRTVTALEGGV